MSTLKNLARSISKLADSNHELLQAVAENIYRLDPASGPLPPDIEAATGIHDLVWKRNELDAQNRHLNEAISQKSALLNELEKQCRQLKRRRQTLKSEPGTSLRASGSIGTPVILIDAIELACKDLPKGWILSLGMERGAAWVTLYDRGSAPVDLGDTADLSLAEQLYEGVKLARGKAEVE